MLDVETVLAVLPASATPCMHIHIPLSQENNLRSDSLHVSNQLSATQLTYIGTHFHHNARQRGIHHLFVTRVTTAIDSKHK